MLRVLCDMQVRCQAYSALAHLVPATAAAFPAGPDGAHGVRHCQCTDRTCCGRLHTTLVRAGCICLSYCFRRQQVQPRFSTGQQAARCMHIGTALQAVLRMLD